MPIYHSLILTWVKPQWQRPRQDTAGAVGVESATGKIENLNYYLLMLIDALIGCPDKTKTTHE
jgi:hypothetical protein